MTTAVPRDETPALETRRGRAVAPLRARWPKDHGRTRPTGGGHLALRGALVFRPPTVGPFDAHRPHVARTAGTRHRRAGSRYAHDGHCPQRGGRCLRRTRSASTKTPV